MRAGVAQPVKVRGEPIAVFLFVLTKPLPAVTATERRLMAELAETAAVPLETARLQAAVEAVGGS
jgi:GAF domain-containing protein